MLKLNLTIKVKKDNKLIYLDHKLLIYQRLKRNLIKNKKRNNSSKLKELI